MEHCRDRAGAPKTSLSVIRLRVLGEFLARLSGDWRLRGGHCRFGIHAGGLVSAMFHVKHRALVACGRILRAGPCSSSGALTQRCAVEAVPHGTGIACVAHALSERDRGDISADPGDLGHVSRETPARQARASWRRCFWHGQLLLRRSGGPRCTRPAWVHILSEWTRSAARGPCARLGRLSQYGSAHKTPGSPCSGEWAPGATPPSTASRVAMCSQIRGARVAAAGADG